MSNASPFGRNTQTSAIWCRIAGGKIIRSADENTPGAVRVEIMRDHQPTGQHRWELHDETVTGRIIKLNNHEQTFHGEVVRSLIVTLAFGSAVVKLSLKEGDRYWRAFMMRLPNVDVLKPVTIAPYDFEPQDGGRRIGLNIMQDDAKVQPVWTRDNPGQLPQMERVMYKGKERPDFTRQDEWLNTNVLIPVALKVQEMNANVPLEAPPAPAPAPAERPAVANPPVEEDDLPF